MNNWYLTEKDRPLIAMSVGTVGWERGSLLGDHNRQNLAGNMSPNYPKEISEFIRQESSDCHVGHFLRLMGCSPGQTVVMKPQHNWAELRTLCVDEFFRPRTSRRVTIAPVPGDMIYTWRRNTVLGCRPADCPVIVGSGLVHRRPLLFLIHLGWQGLNAGFTEAAFAHLRQLNASPDSLRLFITPGASPASFHYRTVEHPLGDADMRFTHPDRDRLFVNIRRSRSLHAPCTWAFDIDMLGFLLYQLGKLGIEPWQIFADDTDTASPASGYFSRTRSANTGEREGRDLIIARLRPYDDGLPPYIRPR